MSKVLLLHAALLALAALIFADPTTPPYFAGKYTIHAQNVLIDTKTIISCSVAKDVQWIEEGDKNVIKDNQQRKYTFFYLQGELEGTCEITSLSGRETLDILLPLHYARFEQYSIFKGEKVAVWNATTPTETWHYEFGVQSGELVRILKAPPATRAPCCH
ncbi:hypothetical protein QOT17_005072 [Balamuthia mandrillaris]